MKILYWVLKLCLTLCIFSGFSPAYAAPIETTSTIMYKVVGGDTLSAIAKKFPGTTWQTIAQNNRITHADLIYPNAILVITQTDFASKEIRKNAQNVKTSLLPLSRTSLVETVKRSERCDVKHGLDQLKYPTLVRNIFVSAHSTQGGETTFERERVYVAIENNLEYVFHISTNCIYTKLIRVTSIARKSSNEYIDRSVTGASKEFTPILPPEYTPGYVMIPTKEITVRDMYPAKHEDDSEMRRKSIQRFFATHVGPPYDIDRMQKIVFERMSPDTR